MNPRAALRDGKTMGPGNDDRDRLDGGNPGNVRHYRKPAEPSACDLDAESEIDASGGEFGQASGGLRVAGPGRGGVRDRVRCVTMNRLGFSLPSWTM